MAVTVSVAVLVTVMLVLNARTYTSTPARRVPDDFELERVGRKARGIERAADSKEERAAGALRATDDDTDVEP